MWHIGYTFKACPLHFLNTILFNLKDNALPIFNSHVFQIRDYAFECYLMLIGKIFYTKNNVLHYKKWILDKSR